MKLCHLFDSVNKKVSLIITKVSIINKYIYILIGLNESFFFFCEMIIKKMVNKSDFK